jgi:hypothetical protein
VLWIGVSPGLDTGGTPNDIKDAPGTFNAFLASLRGTGTESVPSDFPQGARLTVELPSVHRISPAEPMKLLSQYSGYVAQAGSCEVEDEAVVGLEASIRSSGSLRAILELARKRCTAQKGVDGERLHRIETICVRYEEHEKAVRDHCLDYFNAEPSRRVPNGMLHERTVDLLVTGRRLYADLRKTILTSY